MCSGGPLAGHTQRFGTVDALGSRTLILDSPRFVQDRDEIRRVLQKRLVALEFPYAIDLARDVGYGKHHALDGPVATEQRCPVHLEGPAAPVFSDDGVSVVLDQFARLEHLPKREFLPPGSAPRPRP
jgi:hypothetical protein